MVEQTRQIKNIVSDQLKFDQTKFERIHFILITTVCREFETPNNKSELYIHNWQKHISIGTDCSSKTFHEKEILQTALSECEEIYANTKLSIAPNNNAYDRIISCNVEEWDCNISFIICSTWK